MTGPPAEREREGQVRMVRASLTERCQKKTISSKKLCACRCVCEGEVELCSACFSAFHCNKQNQIHTETTFQSDQRVSFETNSDQLMALIPHHHHRQETPRVEVCF